MNFNFCFFFPASAYLLILLSKNFLSSPWTVGCEQETWSRASLGQLFCIISALEFRQFFPGWWPSKGGGSRFLALKCFPGKVTHWEGGNYRSIRSCVAFGKSAFPSEFPRENTCWSLPFLLPAYLPCSVARDGACMLNLLFRIHHFSFIQQAFVTYLLNHRVRGRQDRGELGSKGSSKGWPEVLVECWAARTMVWRSVPYSFVTEPLCKRKTNELRRKTHLRQDAFKNVSFSF